MRVGSMVKTVVVVTLAVALTQVPGREPGPGPQAAPPRPRGPLAPDSCGTCHPGVAAHDVLHGPVGVNACTACHRETSVENHTFAMAREGAALCTFCHDLDMEPSAIIHAPLETGDCIVCHDPHGGTNNQFLRAPTADALCRNCHEDPVGNAMHVHGPVGIGACTVCHEAHASRHEGLLTTSAPQLCTNCHASTQRQLETQRVLHQPAAEACQTCHDPHASNFPMMLRAEPQVLCLSCHETIKHTVETASHPHAAVTTDRQCLNCHDPHASDHPRVLRDDMQTLCFECHDRKIELPDGSAIADMKAIIEGGTSLHGPVAQHNCAACHLIHGGDNFRMLLREYPPEFYAPFAEESYALCFSCHEKQLVLDARTTTLTDFRNGDLNLHYLHVNRDKKGRTCRACHETHASRKDKHIRESVPFGSGGWELPINFDNTATGGSCAPGCHKPIGYDRVEPIPYGDPVPAIWPKTP